MMWNKSWNKLAMAAALALVTQGACKSVDTMKKDAQQLNKDANEAKDKAEEAKAQTEAEMGDAAVKASLGMAVADGNRPATDVARDVYRHPAETLYFFDVKPESTVLELWPGRGWYTRILGPYVGAKGKLYVTNYSPEDPSEYRAKMAGEYTETIKTIPNNGNISVIGLEPAGELDLGLENEVDVVLTFRNVHNWMKDGSDVTIYEQVHKALKPDGIFGIVEHRAKEGTTREESMVSGYVDQQQLIAEVEQAGFELVEASEINANPKDTKDYPEGVWTLPPSLRLKEQDADKYIEIGESDRMTLKFKKVAKPAEN